MKKIWEIMKQAGAYILALGAAALVAIKAIAAKKKQTTEIITQTNNTMANSTSNPLIQHNPLYDQSARGYRNNNPLNIRIGSSAWKGKVPLSQNTDRSKKTGKMEFEQFYYMPYGFRAGMINIRTQVYNGYNTIEKLINRWAPAGDGNNNPSRYIARVCNETGYNPTDKIVVTDPQMMQHLAYAMSIVENGSVPQWDDIRTGWELI